MASMWTAMVFVAVLLIFGQHDCLRGCHGLSVEQNAVDVRRLQHSEGTRDILSTGEKCFRLAQARARTMN